MSIIINNNKLNKVFAIYNGIKLTCKFSSTTYNQCRRNEQNIVDVEQDVNTKGGFARAFEKYTAPQEENKSPEENQTFASMLRNSKFIDLGDPEGKIVSGTIFHVVGDDLYIDFGWKFHCVCTRPSKGGSAYVKGSQVRLRIKDLELSTKFLGSAKDLTILEADCQLMGLISSSSTYIPKIYKKVQSE